jgi:protein-L-isoaspartate(D-aspartate) O-methyltransferase
MWRNEEVLEFVDWLRDWNAERSPEDRVAIHGLDLYSLSESIAQVVAFLEQVDPELATVARHRYGCMNPYVTDPAIYGYAAWTGKHRSCEDQAVAVLRELLARRLDYIERTSVERVFDAEANARVVADAERYYRTMYQGGSAAWNLRDEHMFGILLRLLDLYGPDARAVVWAHNSHLGDARATEMSQRGELNVGQLVRQHFKLDAFAIGFGTHSGTVAAARQWDEPVTIMRVRPSLDESYERVFHDSLLAGAFVPLRPGVAPDIREELEQSRLERAIGVIYRPETERQSHYFGALLPDQFDEYIWLDLTHAIRPLGPAKAPPAPGHPFAPLDV